MRLLAKRLVDEPVELQPPGPNMGAQALRRQVLTMDLERVMARVRELAEQVRAG